MSDNRGIRVSSIGQWSTCEAMALESPRREGTLNAATYVGQLAHARLTGMEVDEPPRITWDSTTRSEFHAQVQADAIRGAAVNRLAAEKLVWSPLDTEVLVARGDDVGHLDMIATHIPTRTRAIIDLKTGKVGAGWLQLGGYLAMLNDPEVEYGGILHVPRVKIGHEPTAQLTLRLAPDLIAAWKVARTRVAEVLSGARPTRSPGVHCRSCRAPNCAVRELDA